MNNKVNREDNDSKKILTLIALIATLMITTTSATYAYFAITSPSNNSMTGTAATAGLIITNSTSSSTGAAPSLIAPTNSTYTSLPMVPQYSYRSSTNVLQKAFNGASGKDKCVDANGNVICRAYTFVVRNTSTAKVNVRGSVTFSFTNTFTNLRWKLMDSATAVTVSSATAGTGFSTTAPIKATTSKVYFDTSNVLLSANGGNKQYWFIVWIEETGADQNTTDKGTWYANISFDVFDTNGSTIGGITSTITS